MYLGRRVWRLACGAAGGGPLGGESFWSSLPQSPSSVTFTFSYLLTSLNEAIPLTVDDSGSRGVEKFDEKSQLLVTRCTTVAGRLMTDHVVCHMWPALEPAVSVNEREIGPAAAVGN